MPCETSVFHGLSFGKIGQSPIVGLPANPPVPGAAPPPPVSPPGEPVEAGVRTVTRRTFAQRFFRHARTE